MSERQKILWWLLAALGACVIIVTAQPLPPVPVLPAPGTNPPATYHALLRWDDGGPTNFIESSSNGTIWTLYGITVSNALLITNLSPSKPPPMFRGRGISSGLTSILSEVWAPQRYFAWTNEASSNLTLWSGLKQETWTNPPSPLYVRVRGTAWDNWSRSLVRD